MVRLFGFLSSGGLVNTSCTVATTDLIFIHSSSLLLLRFRGLRLQAAAAGPVPPLFFQASRLRRTAPAPDVGPECVQRARELFPRLPAASWDSARCRAPPACDAAAAARPRALFRRWHAFP